MRSASMASARTFQLPRSCSALTVSEGTNPNSMAPLITAAMTRSPPGGSARSNPAPATPTRGGALKTLAPLRLLCRILFPGGRSASLALAVSLSSALTARPGGISRPFADR